MFWLIVLIVAFLLLSGVMAAVDAALLSVTSPEVHELIHQRQNGARALKTVRRELTRAIVVIVIATNTINVLGPVLVSRQTMNTIGAKYLGVVAVVLTIGTILISEIIPKAVGRRYATTIGCLAASPILVLQAILYPVVITLEWLSEFFATGTRQIGTEEQIRTLATMGRRAGYIEQDEGHLIRRTFFLNDRTAENIMTPLSRVVSIAGSSTIGDAVETAQRSAYSRFPVFGATPDEIIGMVLIRDLLAAAADGRRTEPVTSLIRKTEWVYHHVPADDLLRLFRATHNHLAIVRRGNTTLGIVTLEDVLEQLVGSIEDEKDIEHKRTCATAVNRHKPNQQDTSNR
ncbi:MAG: HlyC/CorC family transporter [Planctomycetaceae bacterium]|nr:HlyC/CorC family transporter [Planctomycetaceae bacterium]